MTLDAPLLLHTLWLPLALLLIALLLASLEPQ